MDLNITASGTSDIAIATCNKGTCMFTVILYTDAVDVPSNHKIESFCVRNLLSYNY